MSATQTTTTAATAKGRETREKMVRAAAILFRRQGYDGTGVNEILERSGAPRGSFYFHFPGGKEELAVEAVRAAGSGIGSGITTILDSAEDVGEGIARVVEFLADDLERSGFRGGCPIAAVTLDAAGASERVREACAASFETWQDAIAARLRRAGWSAAAAQDEAVVTLAAFEGGLVVSRARRDVEPLRVLARRLRRLEPRDD
jgi:TetR/AcrR family transcriptional regulator, lmrAB and yxaGH operons repressor